MKTRMGDDRSPLDPRLPADAGYWDSLAARITASAEPELRRLRARPDPWWGGLARRCPALATAAGVALAAAAVVLAGAGPSDVPPDVEVARAIGPSDRVARTYFGESRPPTVEALLPVLISGEGGER